MAKIGEEFKQYVHNVLALDALGTAYGTETAEQGKQARESQEERAALDKGFLALFGTAVTGGKSWFVEGESADDTLLEIQQRRQKVARFLNVADEIQKQERSVHSALSGVDRRFEIGQGWAALAESTLAKWDGVDVPDESCDEALEGLDRYSEALAEVVQLHGAMISAHHGFASAEQRVSGLERTIRNMLSNRPCRLPEIETWATGATSLLEERTSVEGSTEALELYCGRLTSAIDQRKQIVANFRDGVAKLQSNIVAGRADQANWQTTFKTAEAMTRKADVTVCISSAGVMCGIILALHGCVNAPTFIANGGFLGFFGGAILGVIIGAAVIGPLVWAFQPSYWVRREAMNTASARLEASTRDCANAELQLRELAALDPSDPAFDPAISTTGQSGGKLSRR
jgi:hypothetical protein